MRRSGLRPSTVVAMTVALAVAACGSGPIETKPTATAAPTSVPTSSPARSVGGPTETPKPPVEHRIGVRVVDGAGEFYDRVTGERWVPRGMNLVRLASYHVILDPGRYDPAAYDEALARMAASGYNTVRLFMNHGRGGLVDDAGHLSAAHMDNVVDALSRAKVHGMQVILTQDWNPDSPDYPIGPDPDIEHVNSVYLATAGLTATRAYYRDFVRALVERGAPFDALWAYELRNELYFALDHPPFSLSTGMIRTVNGSTYDMASPEDRRRMLEEGLVYWFDQVRATILEEDPTALVTVGFFEPQGPVPSRVGDTRIIETEEVILRSTADFIDLHGYPGGAIGLPQLVENFKLPAVTTKPIVLGEFGAEQGPYPAIEEAVRALVEWQIESCAYGFDGWLFWSWDGPGQPEFWKAVDADGALERALSPTVRPDPCGYGPYEFPVNHALDASARASRSTSEGRPSSAIDGFPATSWLAGEGPAQWIEIDLGAVHAVDEIQLQVEMYPAGEATHQVHVGPTASTLRRIATLSGPMTDGQVLTVRPDTRLENVRIIRVTTTRSPSHVAWSEIVVLGPR